jgi:hypothetical protein
LSRTDHTEPWWVTAIPVADHAYACTARRTSCDLPVAPNHRDLGAPRAFRRPCDASRCIRSLPRTWRPDPAPRWLHDHIWTNPPRVAVRDESRRALAEHRATLADHPDQLVAPVDVRTAHAEELGSTSPSADRDREDGPIPIAAHRRAQRLGYRHPGTLTKL